MTNNNPDKANARKIGHLNKTSRSQTMRLTQKDRRKVTKSN